MDWPQSFNQSPHEMSKGQGLPRTFPLSALGCCTCAVPGCCIPPLDGSCSKPGSWQNTTSAFFSDNLTVPVTMTIVIFIVCNGDGHIGIIIVRLRNVHHEMRRNQRFPIEFNIATKQPMFGTPRFLQPNMFFIFFFWGGGGGAVSRGESEKKP